MTFFVIFLYLALGSILVYLLFDKTESESWTTFKYSIAHSIIFYVVVPLVYLVFGNQAVLKNSEYENLNNIITEEQQLNIFFHIFLFFIFYIGVYKIVARKSSGSYLLTPKYLGGIVRLKMLSPLLTILGLFSLVFFVYGLGGWSSAIINAALIRSGLFDEVTYVNSSSTFFFRFVFWAIVPLLLYLSFKKYFLSDNHFSKLVYYYLPFALLLTLYLFFAQGRQYIFDLILIFVLAYLIERKSIVNWKLLLAIPLVFLFQYAIKSFFNYLAFDSKSEFNDLGLSYFFTEYGFPFSSVHYALNLNESYFYFKDFFYGIFGSILPTSGMLGNEILNYNSKIALANTSTTVSIPSGIIASGVYNFGIIGLIITATGSAIFLGLIDKVFNKLILNDSRIAYIYCFLITHTLVMFRTGSVRFYYYDPRLWLVLIVVFLCFEVHHKKDLMQVEG